MGSWDILIPKRGLNMKPKRLHYGWLMSIEGALLIFCTAGITVSSISVLMPYIVESGVMNRTEVSMITSVRSFFVIIALPLVPRYLAFLGIRKGCALASLVSCISFILLSFASTTFSYYFASALAGIAFALGGLTSVSFLMERWFQSRKGVAIGICASGSSMAGIVVPVIFTKMIEHFTLRNALLIEAGFVFAVTILLFSTMRDAPGDIDAEPYLDAVYRESQSEEKVMIRYNSHVPRSAKAFILIASLLIGACACSGYQHLVLLYRTAGFSSLGASLLYALASATQVTSKILFGYIVDKAGVYRANYFFFAMMTIGLFLCALADTRNMPIAIAAVLIYGVGLPLCSVALSIYAHDMASSETEYEKLLTGLNLNYLLGALIYSSFIGIIAEQTNTYTYAYMMLVAISVVAMFFVQHSYKQCNNARTFNQPPSENCAGREKSAYR